MPYIRHALTAGSVVLPLLAAFSLQAADKSILEICKPDLDRYCSQVTPGGSRIVACLYAHGGKISTECDIATGDLSDSLDRHLANIRTMLESCAGDIEKLCSQSNAGEGSVSSCLSEKQAELAASCGWAADDQDARMLIRGTQ